MKMIQKLLELRKAIKKSKPEFIRQDMHRMRLKRKWKKPTGLQSKVRMGERGHPVKPSSGYRSPRAVRGLTASGKQGVIVATIPQLDKLDKNTQSAIVSGTVGRKNRIQLLEAAISKGVEVANIFNVAKTLEALKKKQ